MGRLDGIGAARRPRRDVLIAEDVGVILINGILRANKGSRIDTPGLAVGLFVRDILSEKDFFCLTRGAF